MPPTVDIERWQNDVEVLWQQGQRQAAIDLLLERINARLPAIPRMLGLQLVYYVFLLGDLAGAERFLHQLRNVHPDDLQILENLAVVLSRQGKAAEAVPLFEQVVARSPQTANAWDGLTACLARLNRFEEARRAGEQALALKTGPPPDPAPWHPPSGTPQRYLDRPGHEQRRDVVAFSLWGDNPRYLRGALRNALLIPELYPGWQARWYLDDSVPEEFRVLLQQLGGECRLLPAGQNLRQKLCWRFLVANDPAVGRFLVRDCDSVVSQREVAAVQRWLASDRWFHVMRDWWTHTDPILAGLWGGIAGVLPDLTELLSRYSPVAKETANVDQWFLRDVLWGTLRPHALIHDRCFGSEGSQPWPVASSDEGHHVGQNEFAVNRQAQALRLAAWLQRYPCLQLDGDAPVPMDRDADPADSGVVMARWPGPLPLDSAPPMPALVSGFVLNLPGCQQRWQAMAAQLDRLGWGATHRRFEALAATAEEAKAVGLQGAGELGLWRTTRSLLDHWLAGEPEPECLLHVIEDDAILHPALPLVLEPLRTHRPPLDILFTEAFLSRPLYRRCRALERQRQRQGAGVLFLQPGQYLACASSYLLGVSGARRLRQVMQQREQSGVLLPIDMLFRDLLRRGELKGSISLPFFSTIAAETSTAIQGYRRPAVRLAQSADLGLRRLLYLQTWDPAGSAAVLGELSALLAQGLEPEQLQNLVLEILQVGRQRGWMEDY